jgi:hypothetical protein
VSSEIIPKENLRYTRKGSSLEYSSLSEALGWSFNPASFFDTEKVYTLDQLSQFVKDNIKMYQKDLTELPWDKVRWQPSQQSCACFGCRLSRRVSRWFRGRK